MGSRMFCSGLQQRLRGWRPYVNLSLIHISLVESRLVTRQIVLTVGYDIENLTDKTRSKAYHGEVKVDRYGRKIPKHAHGTANLPRYTSSSVQLMDAVTELFERIADKNLLAVSYTHLYHAGTDIP